MPGPVSITRFLASRQCFLAFPATIFLPSGDFGPVENWAFRRLASIFFVVVRVFAAPSTSSFRCGAGWAGVSICDYAPIYWVSLIEIPYSGSCAKSNLFGITQKDY